VDFSLARGHHGPAASIPAPPTGGFNALTFAGARVKDESMPRRTWESRPSTAPPTLPARPSPPLCDAVRHGQQQPRGTVPPTPVRPTRRTLEKRRRSPEGKANDYAAPAQGQRRDVGPAGPVTSVAIGPVRPSPPSPNTIPATVSPSPTLWERAVTGHRHAGYCASYGLTSMAPSSPHRAATEQATPTPPPSEPLLDVHRARHDASPDARFARTAVYSTTLYTVPLHVDEVVWHACKLPPPWPIKGGAVP
jgi:hypothetical protein